MRLGIDTGGTFTDAVLYDSNKGIVRTAKSLTTHYDLSVGVRDVINRIDSDETPLSDLIQVTSISTTLATNAIVEGRGGTVCLLLIGYPPDALDRAKLRDAIRNDPIEFIPGGHTASGDESHSLDLDAARSAILRHAPSVTAFTVAGMFSVRNTEHEVAVRNLVLELTDKPVTCTFELTANLNAPRRAMTAVLNARLIAPISHLIKTVRSELAAKEVSAPLMVVKGDGSMMSADVAMLRPVETILSGPAASIVGAIHLANSPVTVVSDIGGTTTDIAVLHDGNPQIAREGALVGGFRTFVEAIDVYTVGLGGDSQVSMVQPLSVGPNRAMPISCLGQQIPQILDILEQQLTKDSVEYQGCFLLRRSESEDINSLARNNRKLWNMLERGPVRCDELFKEPHMLRAYHRMRTLDLVHMAAFTPTDALHVLGLMNRWSKPGAEIAARIWMKHLSNRNEQFWNSPEELCSDVLEAVVRQSSASLIEAIAVSENSDATKSNLGDYLLHRGIDQSTSDTLNVELSIKGALTVVGAPAMAIYPQVSKRLNTELIIADHHEIGNAVGAAIGTVKQRVASLITSPAEGVYRAHTPSGIQDYNDLEDAATAAINELETLAKQRALASSAADVDTTAQRTDIVVKGVGGHRIFIESRITVTIQGDVEISMQSLKPDSHGKASQAN